jgi:hypothetical protein
MSSVTLTRRRRERHLKSRYVLVSAAVVTAVSLVASGCSGDDAEPGADASGTGSQATDTTPVSTVTTLANLGKGVSDAKRAKIKDGVTAAVDPWLDGAFLGDFPRSDWTAAFTTFTAGAAADAEGRDLALLSNAAIADRIDGATATRRRVRAEVFSDGGHARGATAYVTLDFDTSGDLAESRRVSGRLYLVKDKGAWRVFGYDVDEAATR